MNEKLQLEQKIIELKLEKRDLVLAGKNTNRVDEKIKNIEDLMENFSSNRIEKFNIMK